MSPRCRTILTLFALSVTATPALAAPDPAATDPDADLDAEVSAAAAELEAEVEAALAPRDGEDVEPPPTEAPGEAAADPLDGDLLLRLRNRRAVPTPSGQVGLLRVHAADSLPRGRVSIGAHGQVFHDGSFLGASTVSEAVRGGENTFVGGDFALGFTPLDFLETWLRYRNWSNKNPRGTPNPKQVQGDIMLGVKGFYPVHEAVTVGADVEIGFLNGVGDTALDADGTTARLGLLATVDARQLAREAVVRLHVNTAFTLGRTLDLASQVLDELEEFELGVHGFHRFHFGLGLEFPLPYVQPFFEYSLEIPLNVEDTHLKFSRDVLNRPLPRQVPYGDLVTHRLAPGLRVTAIPDLTLSTAIEIGVAATTVAGVPAVAPWMFHFGLTYAFDPLGMTKPREVVKTVERRVEVAPEPTTGRVAGRVLDADSGEAVGGAILSFLFKPAEAKTPAPWATPPRPGPERGAPGAAPDAGGGGDEGPPLVPLTPRAAEIPAAAKPPAEGAPPAQPAPAPPSGAGRQATPTTGPAATATSPAPAAAPLVPIGQRPDPAAASPPPDVPEKSALPPVASAAEDGRFMSYDLPPGRVVVRAARDGYEAQDVTVDVQVGDTVVQEIRLTPEVRTGTLSLRVTDDRGVPLKATVWVSGPSGTVALESGGDGRLEQTLPEGDHTVAAVAPGRLARGQRFAVPVRKKVAAALSLPALPGELAARLDGEAIVLLQPVGFTGADVDPTTTAALDHAAHIILTQPGIGRIRVEGHTATDGAPEVNMEASQARAESALRYLVQRGVPASRLTAQGFGDMKPIAPNFTKQGREKNRRIELKVLGPTSGGRS